MIPIHNILVIVDPTADQHPAVVKGAQLAEKLDARLELFACETKASKEARLTLQSPNAKYASAWSNWLPNTASHQPTFILSSGVLPRFCRDSQRSSIRIS